MVSDECKDLIKKLLTVNSSKRIDGKQAIKHPWFIKFHQDKVVDKAVDDLNQNVFARLKDYKGVSHLKRACMNMLIKMATENEVADLTKFFQEIDLDG